MNFANQHPRESILILEEGNQLHPWCPQYDMFVPQEALNQAHHNSAMCRRGTDRKQRSLAVYETEEQIGSFFSEYGIPLTVVSLFS